MSDDELARVKRIGKTPQRADMDETLELRELRRENRDLLRDARVITSRQADEIATLMAALTREEAGAEALRAQNAELLAALRKALKALEFIDVTYKLADVRAMKKARAAIAKCQA